MALNVVLAGGGTAGHVNPLLATAAELVQHGANVTVLGTHEGLEADLVPAAGHNLVVMPKVALPRKPTLQWLRVPGRLRRATRIASQVIESADVVVGFGGYVAAPAYFAASKLGVPFVVQEQNMRPGVANKVGARRAAAVALTFAETPLAARRGATRVTGLPMRRQIMDLAALSSDRDQFLTAKRRARLSFGLQPDVPTLLVTGGSLGAQRINDAFVEAARDLSGFQILHVAGKSKAHGVQRAADASEITWKVHEYLSNLDQAILCADLVVGRAGAGTVCELTAVGTPAVYVPLPIGNGEQAKNAHAQVAAGGALLIPDSQFDKRAVLEKVVPLLADQERLRAMASASASVSPGDGAANLAKIVMELA